MTLQKELSHDQAEKFLRALGPGASKNKVGQTTIYSAPAIPDSMKSKILVLSTSHFNAGRDAINPMGLKAFDLLNHAFAEILRVHSYSAFSFESKESMTIMHTLVSDATGTQYLVYKDDEVDRSRDSRYLQQMNRDNLDNGGMDLDGAPLVDEHAAKLQSTKGYFRTDGYDTVFTAKPPISPCVNVGSSNAVPNEPGILFPYFNGLLQPDPMCLTNFVTKHLFQLLGSTVQECQETYASLRRGFNSLATTDVGMAMTHIATGIELALSTQGRCFVIIESRQYMGFVILGARLAIFDSTKWISSYEEDQLRRDLAIIDPHQSAVLSLVSVFQEMTVNTLYRGPEVTEKTFSDPKDLIDVFGALEIDRIGDLEKELNRNLRCLNYMGDGYIQKNPQTVAEALETIFSDTVIELTRPTYIPSIRAPIASREFAVLSRFGPDAPSLWNERGQDYQCVAREAPSESVLGKRKMGDLDIYANMPSRLLVTPKPLEIAVKDMAKLIEKGGVRMDLKERAGKNRNMSVEAELMRKKIWLILVNGLKEANAKKRKVTIEKKDSAAAENFDDVLNDILG